MKYRDFLWTHLAHKDVVGYCGSEPSVFITRLAAEQIPVRSVTDMRLSRTRYCFRPSAGIARAFRVARISRTSPSALHSEFRQVPAAFGSRFRHVPPAFSRSR